MTDWAFVIECIRAISGRASSLSSGLLLPPILIKVAVMGSNLISAEEKRERMGWMEEEEGAKEKRECGVKGGKKEVHLPGTLKWREGI